MAENDVEDRVFPNDWEGLEQFDEVMNGLPDMVQAEQFTPSQTALFTVIDTRLGERLERMRDGGMFGGKAKRNADNDTVSLALAEYVEISDSFYKTLAVDADAYAKWVQGRSIIDLFGMFSLLQRFYNERLGKSSASKKQSQTVE